MGLWMTLVSSFFGLIVGLLSLLVSEPRDSEGAVNMGVDDVITHI